MELSVAESTTRAVTILGVVIWVEDQTLGPLEATFEHAQIGGHVTAVTVRAGHRRVNRRDAPKVTQSARVLQRIIAARPTTQDDWMYVTRYELG